MRYLYESAHPFGFRVQLNSPFPYFEANECNQKNKEQPTYKLLFIFFLTLQTGEDTGFDFAIYEMYPFNPLFAVAFGQHVLSR